LSEELRKERGREPLKKRWGECCFDQAKGEKRRGHGLRGEKVIKERDEATGKGKQKLKGTRA